MNKNLSKLFLTALFLTLVIVYAYFYATRRATPTPPPDIRVTTDTLPTTITVTGTYTCLSKVNTGGPVTLECALGLQTDAGYYALDTSVVLTANYPALRTGESITVEGTLVPIEMVSADRWQTYDVVGIIAVEKLIKN